MLCHDCFLKENKSLKQSIQFQNIKMCSTKVTDGQGHGQIMSLIEKAMEKHFKEMTQRLQGQLQASCNQWQEQVSHNLRTPSP